MQTILIVFHLFLAAGLIGLILIQHGKGADMGAAFGSGASGTVFGAKGSASFLTRLTAGLATLFFITSMAMAYFAAQRDDKVDFLGQLQTPTAEVQTQPQADVPPVPAPATSDMPPVPVAEQAGEVPAVSVVPAEQSAVPAAEGEKPQAAGAPVETPPAVEGKE
jgi:preprotein translocase subunit SecG